MDQVKTLAHFHPPSPVSFTFLKYSFVFFSITPFDTVIIIIPHFFFCHDIGKIKQEWIKKGFKKNRGNPPEAKYEKTNLR